MTKPKAIAIVTGASAGLGKEFARQLDAAYELDEIWLIARRESAMLEFAKEIKRASPVVIPLDLKEESAWRALENRLKQEKPNVRFLVNNAGLGKLGSFADLKENEQLEMIDLNVRALTALTYIVLPFIAAGGSILQVASSIAYSPAPHFAVYGATKAYVLSLSHALRYELQGRGIAVIAICPGPVQTEFFTVAADAEYAKKISAYLMAKPENVVALALRDLKYKKAVSIYGMLIKLFATVVPFIPKTLLMKIMGKRR